MLQQLLTLGAALVSFIIRTNFLSKSSNLALSLGNWLQMSSLPLKMDYKYCHFCCTVTHTAKTSLIITSFFSHILTYSINGWAHFTLAMDCILSVLSSTIYWISLVSVRTSHRTWPLRGSYLTGVNYFAAQNSLMLRIYCYTPCSRAAARTMLSMSSVKRNSSMAIKSSRLICS